LEAVFQNLGGSIAAHGHIVEEITADVRLGPKRPKAVEIARSGRPQLEAAGSQRRGHFRSQ
jgi:hypothetical protein